MSKYPVVGPNDNENDFTPPYYQILPSGRRALVTFVGTEKVELDAQNTSESA